MGTCGQIYAVSKTGLRRGQDVPPDPAVVEEPLRNLNERP
jgi:hypothetical protein